MHIIIRGHGGVDREVIFPCVGVEFPVVGVVTEISRISRSTKQLLDFIEILKARKLRLRIKDSITIDCRNGEQIDPMTNAMLQIAGVFAELERNMISERVKSGMRAAKAKRKEHPELNPIGRPKKKYADIPQKIKDRFPEYLSGNLNKCEYARLCKVSRPTICKYINIMMEYQANTTSSGTE